MQSLNPVRRQTTTASLVAPSYTVSETNIGADTKKERRQSEPPDMEDEIRYWHSRKIAPPTLTPTRLEDHSTALRPRPAPAPAMGKVPSSPASLPPLVPRMEETSSVGQKQPPALSLSPIKKIDPPSQGGEDDRHSCPGVISGSSRQTSDIPVLFNRTRPQGQSSPIDKVISPRRSTPESRLGEEGEENNSTCGIDGSFVIENSPIKSNTARIGLGNSSNLSNAGRGSASSSLNSVRTMKHHNKKNDGSINGRHSAPSSVATSPAITKKPSVASPTASTRTSGNGNEEQSQNSGIPISISTENVDYIPSSVTTAPVSPGGLPKVKKEKKKKKHKDGAEKRKSKRASEASSIDPASTHSNNKDEKENIPKQVHDASSVAAASTAPQSEVKAASSIGISSDEFMSNKKGTSVQEAGNRSSNSKSSVREEPSTANNGPEPSATESIASKEHSKSRLKAILRKKQRQGENDDKASGISRGSGSSISTTSKLRRYLFSYKKKKRQSNQGGDTAQPIDTNKKNPYALNALDDTETSKGSPICVSSIAKHDVCVTPNSTSSNAHGDIPTPPSLVMSPRRPDFASSINSNSHHCSLISISEFDVLREKDFMKNSAHSDGDIMHRGKEAMKLSSHSEGGIMHRGRDALKFSTHSEGTGFSSLASLDSPNGNVQLNIEDRFKLLSLPLPVHPGQSLSDVGSTCSSIATNYSALRSLRGPGNPISTVRNAFATSDDTTHIINLPWSDAPDDNFGLDPSKRIHGRYTGPVNSDFLQPHGEGTLVVQKGNDSLEFYGRWNNGKLVSPLSAEPEECCENASVEGRRGSGIDPSPRSSPILQPILQKPHEKLEYSTKRSLESTDSMLSSHDVNTSTKNVNIKYVINKSSNAMDSPGKNKHHQIPPLKYTLGEACRTPLDMVIHRSNKKAIQSAALVKKWDHVFVKRSNGVWTVAVMIDRALQPTNSSKKRLGQEHNGWFTVWEIDPQSMELEESMLFAIDGDAATKIINRKSWGKYVRRLKA